MLTPEIMAALRAPVPNVKWKIQTNPKEGKNLALVVAYIDARDAVECLDAATGGNWSSEFVVPPLAGLLPSLECRLTVCGVTRRDVGEVEPDAKDKSWSLKDLYSDALKRAAVQFGVGAFLYRLPKVYARVEQFGNSYALTELAIKELDEMTIALTTGAALGHYKDVYIPGHKAPQTAQSTQATPNHAQAAQRPAQTTSGALQRPAQPKHETPPPAAPAAQRPVGRERAASKRVYCPDCGDPMGFMKDDLYCRRCDKRIPRTAAA